MMTTIHLHQTQPSLQDNLCHSVSLLPNNIYCISPSGPKAERHEMEASSGCDSILKNRRHRFSVLHNFDEGRCVSLSWWLVQCYGTQRQHNSNCVDQVSPHSTGAASEAQIQPDPSGLDHFSERPCLFWEHPTAMQSSKSWHAPLCCCCSRK